MPKATRVYDYTESDVRAALEAVKERKLSLNAASKLFKVPRSTLQFRRSPSFTKTTKGPAAALTPEEEQVFVDWILDCYRRGFPKGSLELCLSVKEFLKQMKRPNMFVDDLPGINWLKNFRKRHPEINQFHKSEFAYRATEQDIRGWFQSVEELLQEQNVSEVLQCANRVFRGDVTTFILDSQKNLVIALKEGENSHDPEIKDAQGAVSAMVTFSASGSMVPPMLVYPYQRIPADLAKEVPETWFIGRSEKGFISAEVFHEYIINAFNTFIDASDIKGPVVLFVDGNSVRLTLQVSQLCTDLQILLIAMYPDSYRILQPHDLALISPIKSGMDAQIAQWTKDNPNEPFTKKHIAPILANILKNGNFVTPCVEGFKAAGLCPWSPDAIDYSRCPPARNGDFGVERNVLTFDRFCSIIGEGNVEMCRVTQQRGIKDEGNILYQLWMEFQRPRLVQEPSIFSLGPPADETEEMEELEDLEESEEMDRAGIMEGMGVMERVGVMARAGEPIMEGAGGPVMESAVPVMERIGMITGTGVPLMERPGIAIMDRTDMPLMERASMPMMERATMPIMERIGLMEGGGVMDGVEALERMVEIERTVKIERAGESSGFEHA